MARTDAVRDRKLKSNGPAQCRDVAPRYRHCLSISPLEVSARQDPQLNRQGVPDRVAVDSVTFRPIVKDEPAKRVSLELPPVSRYARNTVWGRHVFAVGGNRSAALAAADAAISVIEELLGKVRASQNELRQRERPSIASPSDPRLIALEYMPIDVRFGADAEVVMR